MSEDQKQVVVRPQAGTPDPETAAAQKQWVEDGTVPASYIERMCSSASTASLPDAAQLIARNVWR